jgi:hypothetical protein
MKLEKIINLAQKYTVKEISLMEEIPVSTIYYKLRKSGVKPIVAEKHVYNFFDSYTPESCYWAGFIAADGNVFVKNGTYRIAIQLSARDIKHLKKFRHFIGVNKKIYLIKQKACSISLFSKHATHMLINNFNVVPKKSLILEPPKNIPNSMINHYIRGYFDGDGHIGYGGGTFCNFNVVSGSEKMIMWLSNLLQHFNLTDNGHVYKKADTLFSLDINSKKSLDVFDWMYKNSTEKTRLDRKYTTYMDIKNHIISLVNKYNTTGKRVPSGCKGFDLDYRQISKEYLDGKSLRELALKYTVSQWTLLDNFKKLGVRKYKKYLDVRK